MAAGNTLEALLGTYLLRRCAGFRGAFDRIQCVVGFVVLAAGLSTTVSATIGVTSGSLGGVIPFATYGKAWWTWWLGDAMGDLVVAPLLFVWRGRPRIELPPRRLVETGALVVSLVTVSLIVFGGLFTPPQASYLQPYMIFPFLIWAALRFGQHGTVTATFVVATLAIWRTAQGTGPFARETLNESLLLLQAFMGVVAVTMLVLAAVVSERRANMGLRKAHEDLERRVEERTAQLSAANLALQEEVVERKQVENSLRQLSARLLRVQDEERKRLARELHDSTAQGLAALSINLAVAGESRAVLDERAKTALDESLALAAQRSREIRSLSYLLHPPLLEEVGLPSALRWCVEGFARHSGISVDLDLDPELRRLPTDVENAIFRIVQECLTNVHRHSGSSTARIHLARDSAEVTLEVEDEGHGLPAEALMQPSGIENLGLGLLGMRERLRQLGGQLGIDSGSKGTIIRAIIPVPLEGR